MKILVIGDKPSKKTKNNPSMRNLYRWLDMMDAPIVSFCNSHDYEFIKYLIDYDKVIVLGNLAESRYLAANRNVKPIYFKMPHPSPRNRQLNNHVFIQDMVLQCKNYLEG